MSVGGDRLAVGDQSLFNDDDTYFNQVGEMFNQGTLPTAEETLGWWSGRCYRYDSPNRPINDVLVFRTDDRNNNNGPAFPPSYHYQMIALTYDGKPANYYDTLTDVKRVAIKKSLQRWVSSDHYMHTVRKNNGTWFTRGTTKTYAQELRKYQDYFVMRMFSSEDDELTVFRYCYFFKKVHSY